MFWLYNARHLIVLLWANICKSENNNQMIQLTDVFCVLLRYNGTSNSWLQYAADSIIRDPIKRRALYFKSEMLCSKCSLKVSLHWILTGKKNLTD